MNQSLTKIRLLALCAGFALVAAGLFAAPFDAAAQQGGGSIKGAVKSPWVSRYEAVVHVDRVDGQFPSPKEKPFVSQKGLVFLPHVLPVVVGTTVDFTNDDSVAHNVSSPPGSATVFNLGLYGAGVTKTQMFDKPGEVPLLCSVHPEMTAFIVVVQNPYFAVTDKAGNFEIKNVPPGNYQLKVWNEKLQEASQSVTVEAGKTANVEFKDLKKR